MSDNEDGGGDDVVKATHETLRNLNEEMVGRCVQRIGVDPDSGALCVEVQGGRVLMCYGVTQVGVGRVGRA